MATDMRTRFRRLLKPEDVDGLDTTREVDPGPLFGLLDTDTITYVFEILAKLDPALEGCQWRTQKRLSVRSVMGIAGSCVALHRHLEYTARKLYAELVARSCTDVVPTNRINPYLYTKQINDEKHSSRQFKALKLADNEMAYHCSGGCCGQARRIVNGKLRNNAGATMFLPVDSDGTIRSIAPARDAPIVYAQVCKRKVRRAGVHTRPRVCVQRIEHGCGRLINADITELGGEDQPEIVTMSTSHSGSHVAWTMPVSESIDNERDGSLALFAWSDEGEYPFQIHCDPIRNYDFSEGVNPRGYRSPDHPHSMWWTEEGLLIVAWTSTIVHPMGHDELDGVEVDPAERYVIATYELIKNTGACLREASGPFSGRLISTSASSDGSRMVALVRTKPRSRGETLYRAVVHHKSMATELNHSHVWKGKPSKSSGPGGFDWGPSAVGISPAGDCILCVHRTLGTVLGEVFDLDEGARYIRINAHALTEWLGMGGNDHTGDNVVKLRYRVTFSGCGRFACVVDQRSRWRYQFTGYASVVVDLSQRRRGNAIRCQPLCYSDQGLQELPSSGSTPLREVHWHKDRVWLLVYIGAIALQ